MCNGSNSNMFVIVTRVAFTPIPMVLATESRMLQTELEYVTLTFSAWAGKPKSAMTLVASVAFAMIAAVLAF